MEAVSQELQGTQKPWWLSYTGLFPVALVLIPVLIEAWTVAVLANLLASAAVIIFHVYRRQGVTTFDVLMLLLGISNAILWFVFDSSVLLKNFSLPIFAILCIQCLISLQWGTPWTTQFARRQVEAHLWNSDAFFQINRKLTLLWGAIFGLCALTSLMPVTIGSIAASTLLTIGVFMSRRFREE